MSVTLLCGDVLDVLAGYGDETFTCAFCDPPYGLTDCHTGGAAIPGKFGERTEEQKRVRRETQQRGGFMGKKWDAGVPGPEYWAEVLRVLRPGGVLMAFGGTRTYHRLTCAIEDAGFEIEDCMMWLYGAGFPKSLDVSKAIDKAAGAEREVVGVRVTGEGHVQNRTNGRNEFGTFQTKNDGYDMITASATPDAQTWQGYGTALKPAYEPIILARKPRGKLTYAECAVRYGAGALWVDGGRVDSGGTHGSARSAGLGAGPRPGIAYSGGIISAPHPAGRWPANLILDEAAAAALDEQSGVSKSTDRPRHNGAFDSVAKGHDYPHTTYGHADTGGASRFFQHCGYSEADEDVLRFLYTSKASRGERDAGLDSNVWHPPVFGDDGGTYQGLSNSCRPVKNPHPTVKPLSLARYLATLILPPESYRDDAALLIPFSGVFSEGIGAYLAGWRNITGIDNDAEYVDIGRARFAWWQWAYEQTGISDPAELRKAAEKLEPLPLLAALEAAQ